MDQLAAASGGAPFLAPDRLDPPQADPLLLRLFPALPTGVEWELARMERALASVDDPHRAFRAVHIGGTNGKGSVTAMVASVLSEGGRRTAAYTSPHLCSFRERLMIDGAAIPEDSLVGYADDVRDAIVRYGLTFFEAATLLAFHAFREEAVELAAVEVGLGGRLDATNVLRPEVAAVTNVAMDHAEYLGSTIAEIAAEKAGIMKPSVPFLTADTDEATLRIFRDRGRVLGAPVFGLDPEAVRDVVVSRGRTAFRMATRRWGALDVVTPLAGRHQAVNTALAIEILGSLPDELRPEEGTLLEGILAARHRGRDEVRVIDGRTWLFDVAHNVAGVGSLLDTLARLELPRPLVALVGVLSDKDWPGMLPPLLALADSAVLTVPTSAPQGRRWDPSAAVGVLEGLVGAGTGVVPPGGPTDLRAVQDFVPAVRVAAERAGSGTVIVTGSVHTVGDAMAALGIEPLADSATGSSAHPLA